MPTSSADADPAKTMAISGIIVSGRAVPTAASTLPTAPSARSRRWPNHSTPLVNSSAPTRMTTSETSRMTRSIGSAGRDPGHDRQARGRPARPRRGAPSVARPPGRSRSWRSSPAATASRWSPAGRARGSPRGAGRGGRPGGSRCRAGASSSASGEIPAATRSRLPTARSAMATRVPTVRRRAICTSIPAADGAPVLSPPGGVIALIPTPAGSSGWPSGQHADEEQAQEVDVDPRRQARRRPSPPRRPRPPSARRRTGRSRRAGGRRSPTRRPSRRSSGCWSRSRP